ncbi:MAG: OmpA family protein [Erythrobacter sp.]
MNTPKYLLALTGTLAATLALAACNSNAPQDPEDGASPTPDTSATPESDPAQTVSILRPEIENPGGKGFAAPIPPLELVINFPKGGEELDEEARTALQSMLDSAQFSRGGEITLRAHSDASGTDRVNLRVSQQRGEAVRDWLIDQGVAAERIALIAFGSQNPVEPNALPDGEANDAGRAANRRVVITVEGDPAEPAQLDPVEAGEADQSRAATSSSTRWAHSGRQISKSGRKVSALL